MRKKTARAAVMVLVMALIANMLAGCGKANEDGDNSTENLISEEIVPTGIYVPVAEITVLESEGLSSVNDYCLQGDSLLYVKYRMDEATKQGTKILYRKSLDGKEEPEVIFQNGIEGKYLKTFFTDREDNLYMYGTEEQGEDIHYYFSKTDKEGNQVFITYPKDNSLNPYMNFSKGLADGDGNSYLYDPINGLILFFDKEGNYIGKGNTSIVNGDMVDAGEETVFLWKDDFQHQGIKLQRLNCEKAVISEEEMVSFSSVSDHVVSYSMLSGYEEGALLSTAGKFYRFDFNTGKVEELLSWDDVNVDGSMVEKVNFLKRDEQGNLEFQALFNSWTTNETELIKISYVDQAYVPQKQVITYGADKFVISMVRKMVQKFNRENQNYKIKMVQCDEEFIREALMYGKEEIPDLLDAGMIPLSLMQKKGLLVDLAPYFEESSVVKKEDILESIWEASLINDKMVRAVMSYTIESYATNSDVIKGPGYTAEDIVAMQQANPESRLLDYCYSRNIIRLVIGSQMDRYVDWENKKANFDSEEFIELLDTLRGISVPEDPSLGRNQVFFDGDEENEKFLNGEFLMRSDSIGSPGFYEHYRELYQDKAHYIGMPTLNGDPSFEIYPQIEFCIYDKSENKEGAWAVIEYMLSEESQSWYESEGKPGFPVRKDAFFSYLEKPRGPGEMYEKTEVKEQYREDLKYMSEYFHINNASEDWTIFDILSEETQALFAGDKTAQNVAEIIQSRVQNYMEEQ